MKYHSLVRSCTGRKRDCPVIGLSETGSYIPPRPSTPYELIQSCLNDNSYAQAQDYIREICTSLNNSQITRYCANEAVNLILSSYIAKADKYNITTQVSVTAANLADYKPTDLCSLFANALENAINACKLVQTAGHLLIIHIAAYPTTLPTTIPAMLLITVRLILIVLSQ